jgi:hypothetical protein
MDSSTAILISILFCDAIFIVIAYTINENNAKYLLSGYNTMSKEEQEKFDLKNYLIFFKNFFLNLGIYSFLIFLLFFFIFNEITATIIWIISVFIPMPYLIYKGYKFKK